MANLYPSGAQALSVSNGATSFTISGILLDLSDVLPGDVLCTPAGSAPILTVTSGGGTLGIGWQAATVSGSTAWWIERRSDQRYSGFYTATQAAKAAQRLAQALTNATVYAVKGETNTPPASPAEGDTYLTGTSPTGAWASNASAIARYSNGAWVFPPFQTGDGSLNTATSVLKVWNGATWASATPAPITDAELLALAGLPSAADKIPYFTGSGTADLLTRDTDGTLAANSDTRLATQKATKTYVDQIIAAQDAMVFKGVIDCSASPNYPAADRGHTYRVSVAGKIGGASGTNVEAGDLLICLTDGTASGNQATVGSAWTVTQANLDGAVIGPASATDGHVAQFDGPTGKLLKGGKAAPSGAFVGTTDTQTLTNKTLLNPTVDSLNGIGPIFILATGQSNMRRQDAYSWSPPSNLLYWNWDQVDGHVGTAFAALDGTFINAGIAFAARVAEAHPSRRVYLVQIGFGSRAITNWLPGTSAPDVYANITANMTPALAAAGVSKISLELWWQGETPATPATYPTDFETVQTRFKGETWFPVETPVVVFGLMPQAIGGNAGQDYMNLQLQRCVAADPSNRIFVYPGWTTAGMWVDVYHPTPAGGYAIGLSAADQFLGRGGARPMAGDMTDYGNGHFYRSKRTVVNLNAAEPLLSVAPTTVLSHQIQADGLTNAHIFDAFGSGNNLQGRRAQGTNATKTQVTVNSALLILTGVGWYTGATDYSTAQVSITLASAEDWTSTARGTRVRFSTTTNGTTTQTGRWDIAHNGDIVPVADNTYNIGSASFRTKELFAGTGTINTSDATEKDWRGGLDEAELRVAMRLTQLMGVYRWKASVAAKGDAARLHVGVTVQAVAEAFKAEGLDPWRYAMCCSDTFDVLVDSGEKDEDGQPIMVATGEKQTRLGLRYDQLYAFVTAAALHQMQAISDRLAALEGH